MGSGFSKKKKQAKMMQQQFAEMQEKLANTEAVGQAGNGLVTVTLTGDHELKGIKIQKECVDPDDIEALEDLICAAYSSALEKLKDQGPPAIPGMPPLGGFGF